MKSRITLVFLLCIISSFGQDKRIALHVNVLGKKHPVTRYYHPIEGEYKIAQKKLVFDEKLIEALQEFVLIQPIEGLTDSSHVLANSLRHYVDPHDLIYIQWGHNGKRDTLYNYSKLDSFRRESHVTRKEKYNHLVQRYFNPFFIKRHEVSNLEYRQFVYWVRDSIFKEEIYRIDEIPWESRLNLLAINDKEIKQRGYSENGEFVPFEESEKENIRNRYPFESDWNFKELLAEYPIIMEYIQKYYLIPGERWYKRRELDVSQLIYNYSEVEYNGSQNEKFQLINKSVAIYPDTLCWIKGFLNMSNDPFTNLYFWHSTYDHYPVSGVSWKQSKAFCHWKSKILTNKFPEIMEHREVGLPRIYEIEWAVQNGMSFNASSSVADNQIITNLLLGKDENGALGQYFESQNSYNNLLTSKVQLPIKRTWSRKQKKYVNEMTKSKEYQINELNNSQIELMKMRIFKNILNSEVEFLSNNVSEWMDEDYRLNYTELIEAYINYNCFADVDYCQYQQHIDMKLLRRNNTKGKLIMGTNWFDERYEEVLGINVGGLYPKRFAHPDSAYSTVGFRYVIRYKPTYYSIHE